MADGEPVEARHHDVEQNEVRLHARKALDDGESTTTHRGNYFVITESNELGQEVTH
jgi:hypothetical protein